MRTVINTIFLQHDVARMITDPYQVLNRIVTWLMVGRLLIGGDDLKYFTFFSPPSGGPSDHVVELKA